MELTVELFIGQLNKEDQPFFLENLEKWKAWKALNPKNLDMRPSRIAFISWLNLRGKLSNEQQIYIRKVYKELDKKVTIQQEDSFSEASESDDS